jgi:hypothetical protein
LWTGGHDSVCGCSHDGVARDVDARHAEAWAIGEALVDEALAALGAQVSAAGVLRFNPSPFERWGVPGLGWRVDPAPVESARAPVELAVGADGWIGVDGVLRVRLLDEPDVGDLYNYCYATEGQVADPPSAVRLEGDEVVSTWDGLTVRLRVRRSPDDHVHELEGSIRNERPDHRLRIAVELAMEATGSVAGSPFELVRRPLRSEGGDVESPSPTWPARHVVLAGGAAAFHEGVFEYEVAGRELLLTLLRCVGTISRDRLATRPWGAGPGVPTPDAQMLGTTTFRIGLRAGASRDDLLADWERFALPLREVVADGGGPLPPIGSLLEIVGDVALSNVRRRDGGVEARLWNPLSDRSVESVVDGEAVRLAPARIETVAVRRA